MNNHRHVFDSRYGYVSGRANPALMCRCGSFGMPGGGEWQAVPKELLPDALRFRSRMRRCGLHLRNCAIALAIGFVLAMWLM